MSVSTKISTRIKQAGFDPYDVEALMYMGEEMVPMYTHALKRSTWSQISWTSLGSTIDNDTGDAIFGVNNGNGSGIDYLLAIAYEVFFPQITLVNTPAPVPFTTAFFDPEGPTPDAAEIVEVGEPLYFYFSDGTSGLPPGTVYVGSLAALTNSVAGGGLAIPPALVQPFIAYSPRHRVGWGAHAVIGAFEAVTWGLDGNAYETLTKHALYNALQFRMREDVYPVAGDEATSLDAVLLPAGVGTTTPVILGITEDERYRAFVAPFTFTTSSLTDRGENGKHKSAFPLFLACKNIAQTRASLIEDLRDLLVLEEEVLPDYSGQSVIFVATPTELIVDPITGAPLFNAYYTNGTSVFEVLASGFVPTNGPTSVYTTSGTFTIFDVTAGVSTTVSPTQPFLVAGFGTLFLEQTGVYLPITRTSESPFLNPFSREFDYSAWIAESNPNVTVRAKALGANVTQLEKGMMKADCRGKKWLYDRYTYFAQGARPGEIPSIDIGDVAGQTKYAYIFGQNTIAALQGQHFNYTNNSLGTIIIDEDIGIPKWVFTGRDSLQRIDTSIRGNPDENHRTGFLRYVDNPLFAQRAPRDRGLHIIRYANWINAIYPDGSINGNWSSANIGARTTPSALVDLEVSPFYAQANTYGYIVHVIVVSWNIAIFEFEQPCNKG